MSVVDRIRHFQTQLRFRLKEAATPHNSAVPYQWHVRPVIKDGSRVCIFVAFAPDRVLSEHSVFHAKAWAEAGFDVVVVVVTTSLSLPFDVARLDFASGVILRLNKGYDFGAWAATISQLPSLRKASLVVTANDSVYGPLSNFKEMILRVQDFDADVIGLLESYEIRRHFQSFMIFFKPRALNSRVFWKFWKSIRSGDRDIVINRYELRLLTVFERNGLRCAALFPAEPEQTLNRTLFNWQELIKLGFPFVKMELLRDNPNSVDILEWPRVVLEWGYDPEIIRLQNEASRRQRGG